MEKTRLLQIRESEPQNSEAVLQELQARNSELEDKYSELTRKQQLFFVLNRVHPEAQVLLLENKELRAHFEHEECNAFVMSIDIRRSTELMLKSRTPRLFAEFLGTLCSKLAQIVLSNYGVYDKFTGDGIMAFFPDFYSGPDCGYYAISAADQCHKVFREHYRLHRNCFTSVLDSVGLGIGIDYGHTHMVQVGDGLTLVGAPVVYACRMSGGDAGQTLLNQPAYEQVCNRFGSVCSFKETLLPVKSEGNTLAYSAWLNEKPFEPTLPTWKLDVEKANAARSAEDATHGRWSHPTEVGNEQA